MSNLGIQLSYTQRMFLVNHREPIVVWRRRRVRGLGGARLVACDAGPRPRGDAERHLPRVVQAAAPPRAQPRRFARIPRLSAAHASYTALRRHVQVIIHC